MGQLLAVHLEVEEGVVLGDEVELTRVAEEVAGAEGVPGEAVVVVVAVVE